MFETHVHVFKVEWHEDDTFSKVRDLAFEKGENENAVREILDLPPINAKVSQDTLSISVDDPIACLHKDRAPNSIYMANLRHSGA